MEPGKANSGGSTSNSAFLTFLHGPRSCIGAGFARGEFALLLAALVGRFEIEMEDPESRIVPGGGLTSKPRDARVRLTVIEEW